MKIVTPYPVRTAARVRQLASTYPVECAKALASQPDAIAEVGSALACLAEQSPASEILSRTLRARPDLMVSARPFYERRRQIAPPTPFPPGYQAEVVITSRQRP